VNIAIVLVANRIGIAIRDRAWPNPKRYGPAPVRPPVQQGEPMLEGRFRPGNEVTKASVSFWLATAKGNVPVKLQVSVDGDAMFVKVVVIGRNDVPAKTGLAQPMLALFKTLKAEAKGLGFKRLVVTADRAPAKWGGTAAVPDRHWFFDWDLGD
jgi:hypothetical protein